MRVHVECVADYRGVEMPRRFHLGRRKVEIVESDDQWHGADYRYFKVKGDDGKCLHPAFRPAQQRMGPDDVPELKSAHAPTDERLQNHSVTS